MTMKNEQVARFIEAALVRRLVRGALRVCASGVRHAVSQIAAARPALTSQEMQKLEAFLTHIFFSYPGCSLGFN